MVSMVLVPYGINPNFDIVPIVMVTSLLIKKSQVSQSNTHNIINLKNRAHRLGRQTNRTLRHQQRLHHILLQNIRNQALSHINASSVLSLGMSVPQLGHSGNRVESSVLRQRIRHNLQRFSKCSKAVLLHACQRVRVLTQSDHQLDLGRAASRDQRPLLHQTPNNAQRVMNRPVRLVQHQSIASPHQHRHRPARVRHSCKLNHSARPRAHLLHQIRIAQHLTTKMVQTGDRLARQTLAYKLNVVSLNVLDHHYFHFGQKVQRQLVHGISQNALLNEQHIAVGCFDFFHNVQNVLAFFFEYAVHLSVVVDDHIVFHVGLGRTDAKLNEANFCLFDLFWRIKSGRFLVKDKAVDELGVVNGAAELLDQLDVAQVHVGGSGRVDDLHDRVDSNGRQLTGELGDHFGVE
ncbi:hypothetical protein BpHYR1_014113 [Brachionus plicatilis]|uniref:Uncharacterized protein n=1 Tax=Brachionus plicatilis TaxID=10195 RepID=A0A3M7RQY3_BRAPC|nr:hypothetical protein BpHYR1_014113 [Brachionus plicatilis]